MSFRKRAQILLEVPSVGLLGGAATGIVGVTAAMLLVPSARADVSPESALYAWLAGGILGGILGMLLGPLIAFSFLRHVQLGRAMRWTATGALLGYATGILAGAFAIGGAACIIGGFLLGGAIVAVRTPRIVALVSEVGGPAPLEGGGATSEASVSAQPGKDRDAATA